MHPIYMTFDSFSQRPRYFTRNHNHNHNLSHGHFNYYPSIHRSNSNINYMQFENRNIQMPIYSQNQDHLKHSSKNLSNLNTPTESEDSDNSLNESLSRNFNTQLSQKLFVVRHGERVDTTFGSNWIRSAFDGEWNYIRFNLNLPKVLPERENPIDFEYDPPLTEIGLLQAKLNGEELAKRGVKIDYIYSSPALRSIQTADKILEGMDLKNKVKIKIETGLFEIMGWQHFNKNPFMDVHSLVKAGYNIETNYQQLVPFEYIRSDENQENFYNRSYYVTKTIVDRHAKEGANIMFVGHAPTIEGCTRQLIGGQPRSLDEFLKINRKVPFLSIAQCEKDSNSGRWNLVPTLIPSMKHTQLDEFNWNDLNSQEGSYTNASYIGNNMYQDQYRQIYYTV